MSKTAAQTATIARLAEWHGTPRPQFMYEHPKGINLHFPSGHGFIITPLGAAIPA